MYYICTCTFDYVLSAIRSARTFTKFYRQTASKTFDPNSLGTKFNNYRLEPAHKTFGTLRRKIETLPQTFRSI